MNHFQVDQSFGFKKAEAKHKKKEVSNNYLLAKSMNIGYYLITPIIFGVFFGFLIDRYFRTKPFFTIVFIVLGVVSSFYNLWKLQKEFS